MDIIKFENFKSGVPEGWVNVKLDRQLYKRMGRYVVTLDKIVGNRNKYDLYKKIEAISNIEHYINSSNISIQSKISIITILQYLKELKTYFDPSSSGFLLEGFLATLIHGKLEEGRGPFDISSSYNELDAVRFKATGGMGKTYQIKLYRMDSNIKVNMSTRCDYYVICLKDGNDIWVHILDGKNPEHDQFIGGSLSAQYINGKVISDPPSEDSYIRVDGNKVYMIINTKKLQRNPLKRKLDVGNLDELIKKCGENIMQSISETYVKLSELHYNIDSLVSGIDKDQKPIDIDLAKSNADQTIIDLTQSISKLSDDIRN
jgi:hypothetical protein